MQEDDAGVARAREGAQAGQTAPSVPGGHPEGRRGPLPGMRSVLFNQKCFWF